MTQFDKSSRVPPGSGRFVPVSIRAEAAERFGSRAQTVQIITFDLATAVTLKEIKLTGNAIWAFDASDNAAKLTVRFNEQSGEGLPFQKGMFIKGIAFDRIFIDNTAQAGKTITILVAVEGDQLIAIENAAEALASITVSGTVTATKPSVLDSLTDVSLLAAATTQILAADVTRYEAIITNLTANTVTFRIGDSGADATNGVELAPGQTIILTTTDAIHGFNATAGAESISVVVIKD